MAKSLVLTGVTGSRVGARTAVTARASVIGSATGCDIMLHDRNVLARHAEIRQVLDRWFIVPIAPEARVFVNGTVVASQGRLLEGDMVTVGTATFRVSLSDSDERAVGR